MALTRSAVCSRMDGNYYATTAGGRWHGLYWRRLRTFSSSRATARNPCFILKGTTMVRSLFVADRRQRRNFYAPLTQARHGLSGNGCGTVYKLGATARNRCSTPSRTGRWRQPTPIGHGQEGISTDVPFGGTDVGRRLRTVFKVSAREYSRALLVTAGRRGDPTPASSWTRRKLTAGRQWRYGNSDCDSAIAEPCQIVPAGN